MCTYCLYILPAYLAEINFAALGFRCPACSPLAVVASKLTLGGGSPSGDIALNSFEGSRLESLIRTLSEERAPA